jgi:MFS family permease
LSCPPPEGIPPARSYRQLGFAAAAVLLASADTYVVVVALPSIMSGVGVGLDQLQRATPIISGFLLGYVVVLPLLGRLSDLAGRRPVFVGCLVLFASGSLVTGTGHSLAVVVAGRGLQGLGGGGLVPVTLALVAERWPPEHRGLPLGVVGAVQELGSLLGPLYGAVVVAVSGWRTIFWINLPLAGILAVGFYVSLPSPAAASRRQDPGGGGPAIPTTPQSPRQSRQLSAGRRDVLGLTLAGLGVAGVIVALWAPASLANSVTYGNLFTPLIGGSTWTTLTSPVALSAAGLLVAFVIWEVAAPITVRTLMRPQRLPGLLTASDLPGALLLGGTLACVVIVFSTADPTRQVVAANTDVVAPLGAACLVGFVWRQRRARQPLIERGVFNHRAAWGALAVNLTVGAGLIAALVDVPFFARSTRYPNSQVGAALILVRFLVAVPIGAVVGGALCRRRGWGPWIAGAGAALAALTFAAMTSWGETSLTAPLHLAGTSLGVTAADLELVLCGLGFGLMITPVNAAILEAVPARVHGLASSLAVVARTVGMIAGLSALTAIGIRRFYQAQVRIGSPLSLCPTHPGSCPAYNDGTHRALLGELHTVFAGAAVSVGVAAVLAVALLRQTAAGSASSPQPGREWRP